MDKLAWKGNPEYNHVYNKMWLCKTQNISHAPWPISPNQFPVFYKPIVNLKGLGVGSFKANEKPEGSYPGFFWMEYLTGIHKTTDAICENGEIVNPITMRAYKDGDRFQRWSPSNTPIDLIQSWSSEYLEKYSGPVNFECIGDKIIECHLRHSQQYRWIYPDCWPNCSTRAEGHILPLFVSDCKKYFYDQSVYSRHEEKIEDIFLVNTLEDEGFPERGGEGEHRAGYCAAPSLEKAQFGLHLMKKSLSLKENNL